MVDNIGVQVTTSTRSGPSNPGTFNGRLHVAGLTEKGSVTGPVILRSLAEYVAVLGGRTPYSNALYDTARTFWEEGGSELVVSRVVGANATKGSVTLMDTAATPAETLRVEAVDPGPHSSTLSVAVVTTEANTFTLEIYRDGILLQRFPGLSSPADAVGAASGSPYVTVSDLGSASVAPTNNPAPLTPTALQAGSDDRANVTADDIIAALAAAGDFAAGGAVAAPGYPADVVGAQLLAHAAANHQIALLAADQNATIDEVTATAEGMVNTDPNGSYGGLFYPHVVIPDGSGSRTVSPEGYVAGVRSRVYTTDGFWQAPAGDRARTRWVLGTSTTVSTEDNDRLAASYVNGIATSGPRVRLYNWTSLAGDRQNLGSLSARDVLNGLTVMSKEALEPFVFSVLDSRGELQGKIESAIVGVLDPVAKRKGLFPRRVEDGAGQSDPGYKVQVDAANDLSNAANNTVTVTISVRLAPRAELIQVEIIKVALQAAA